jgi:hypothetical protein
MEYSVGANGLLIDSQTILVTFFAIHFGLMLEYAQKVNVGVNPAFQDQLEQMLH